MNTFKLSALFGGILLVGAVSYVFLKPNQETMSPENQEDIALLQGDSDSSVIQLQANQYSYPQGMYSFTYPDDYTLDTQDLEHIRIYKKNDT